MSHTITQPSNLSSINKNLLIKGHLIKGHPSKETLELANKIPIDGQTLITPIDGPAVITPTVVNPNQEGTTAAFGGTAGIPKTFKPAEPSQPSQIFPSVYNNTYDTDGTDNILKKDTIFSFSDYNKIMLSKETNNLQFLQDKANQNLLQKANNARFYNLSLSEIVNRTVLVVVAIFNDILYLMKPEEKKKRRDMNYQDLSSIYAKVFLRNDRMIYFGVFLIFISLLFMVVFLSS